RSDQPVEAGDLHREHRGGGAVADELVDLIDHGSSPRQLAGPQVVRHGIRRYPAALRSGDVTGWALQPGRLPQMPTKLTISPGYPPRLCVSARPRSAVSMRRSSGASPRSWSQHSNSIRSPDAPTGWPKDLR